MIASFSTIRKDLGLGFNLMPVNEAIKLAETGAAVLLLFRQTVVSDHVWNGYSLSGGTNEFIAFPLPILIILKSKRRPHCYKMDGTTFLVLLLLASCLCVSCAQRPSDGCGRSTDLEDLQNATIAVEGVDREFLLYIPSRAQPGVPLPLVLNFHGTPSTAYLQYIYTEMDLTAEEHNFIVVFPQGVDEAFNAGGCCAETHKVNDEKFARAIVDFMAAESCVDLDQVFATGWSNGGYMAYYLACRASDVFTAIAPVGGLIGIDPWDDCDPENPPRVLAFHEVLDPDVDYCGVLRSEYAGAEVLVSLFAEKQGCSPDRVGISYQNGQVVCRSHLNCPPGKNATLCSISRKKPTHSWPGAWSDLSSEMGTQDIEGNEQIWSFFAHETPQSDEALVCDPSPGSACRYQVYHQTAEDCNKEEKEEITAVPTEGITLGATTMGPSNWNQTMLPSDVTSLAPTE
jgi:polyhydroxybutyrate depolymerase